MTTTTTARTEITDELRLTMLKHLAAGKDLDTVATVVRIPRPLVLDVVSKHGYPNSLDKGIELLTAKIDKDRNTIPGGRPPSTIETPVGAASTPAPTGPASSPRPATTSPSSVTHPDARPVGAPDEIRVLLNTGKNHPSKRIQGAANRVLDAIGRLRDLLAEDAEKNAAKRAEDAEKVAIRAEVKRLEAQLADAKAKLRGGLSRWPPPSTARPTCQRPRSSGSPPRRATSPAPSATGTSTPPRAAPCTATVQAPPVHRPRRPREH